MNAEEDSVFVRDLAEPRAFPQVHILLTPSGPALVAEPLKGVEAVALGKLVRQAGRHVTVRLVPDTDT
jgi:hypothetical protein